MWGIEGVYVCICVCVIVVNAWLGESDATYGIDLTSCDTYTNDIEQEISRAAGTIRTRTAKSKAQESAEI